MVRSHHPHGASFWPQLFSKSHSLYITRSTPNPQTNSVTAGLGLRGRNPCAYIKTHHLNTGPIGCDRTAQFDSALCTLQAFGRVYENAESGQSPSLSAVHRAQGSNTTASPAEQMQQGTTPASKHLSGDPYLLSHSLTSCPFLGSNENKVCLLSEVLC